MQGKNIWVKYYIPLGWTFTTRYRNIINVISYFIIDAFPSFFVVAMFSNGNVEQLTYWCLAFISMFCFYECGYIFNETICVRFENNPTIRIPEFYFSKILQHVENLITIRLIIGTIGSWILLSKYSYNIELYIILVMTLMIIYSIHNFYRGPINIITMPAEVLLKYMIPISAFLKMEEMLQGMVIIFLVIVIIRTIEYISKKGFVSWIKVTKNVDVFRIKYYLVINIIVGIMIYYHILPILACGLPIIFLLYRIFSYVAIKKLHGVRAIISDGRKMHGTDK